MDKKTEINVKVIDEEQEEEYLKKRGNGYLKGMKGKCAELKQTVEHHKKLTEVVQSMS